MNFVQGDFAARHGAHTVGFRPEHIQTGVDADDSWSATVHFVEHLGAETVLHTKTDAFGDIVVRVGGKADIPASKTITLAPMSSHLHLFDANGMRIDGA